MCFDDEENNVKRIIGEEPIASRPLLESTTTPTESQKDTINNQTFSEPENNQEEKFTPPSTIPQEPEEERMT